MRPSLCPVRVGTVVSSLLLLAGAAHGAPPIAEFRDADHPARHAFQITLCTAGWPPGCIGGSGPSYTVPANKRLVIEYASAICLAPLDHSLTSITLLTVAGGTVVSHHLVPVQVATTATSKHYTAAQQMRLYADPGATVNGSAAGTPTGSVGCLLPISGTLVDL